MQGRPLFLYVNLVFYPFSICVSISLYLSVHNHISNVEGFSCSSYSKPQLTPDPPKTYSTPPTVKLTPVSDHA